jgi:hypothetical protein
MATLLKPPIPENPYFPSGGWNPDAQGLSIKTEECSDILNMRISRREAFTRSGVRRLAKNSLGVNPALALINYKSPTGVETEFAFTKNMIYQNIAQDWTYAVAYSEKDACESTTNFASDLGTPTLSTRHQFGTGSITVPAIPSAITDTQRILGKSTVTWDCSARTHMAIWFMGTNTAAVSAKLNFYSAINYTTLVQSFDITLTANTTTCFMDIVNKMTTPASWSAIKSFDITVNGNQTVGAVWQFWLDGVIAIDALPNDVEYWSTTRYVDSTSGETVVASGSNPPLFDEAEDDQSLRLLYYYNVSSGWFVALTTYKNVNLGDEDTGKTGPATASTVTSSTAFACTSLSGFTEMVGGTISLYTLEKGTLATASSVLSSDRYMFVPTDTTKINAGANSYVLKTGASWSLEFLTADYSGLKIYVVYTYKITAVYKPRFVWNFHNRLLLGGTYEGSNYYPWRIRGSNIQDMDLFVSTDYWDLIDNDISPITAGDHLGFYLTIYKGNSIVKGSYIGGTSIFTFATAWKSGTFAGRTVQSFKEKHYLMGADDVHVWDGNTLESITFDKESGQYRTRNQIFSALNQNQLNKCFGSFYPRFQEYWLWVPKSGETNPSSVYIYSVLLGIWYYFEFTATTCTGSFHSESGATIDELIGTIDDQNWRLDDVSLEGTTQSLLIAPAAGQVNMMDDKMSLDGGYWDADETWVSGTAISTRLITRDFIYSKLHQYERTERLIFEALGVTVDVSYNADYSIDPLGFHQEETLTLDGAYVKRYYFPDAVTEKIRFCFQASDYWSIRWLQPFAIATETVNE